ncbi:MAG: glycosyl hydrolase family 18 protein [Candidatus Saccharibacteria bacterium]
MKRNRFLSLLTTALLIIVILAGPVSPASAAVSNSQWTPPAPAKQVLGFTTYYYSGDKASYNSMVNNTRSLDEIATATHVVDSWGNISGLIPTQQISYANNNGIKPLLMIGNEFDGDVATTLLRSWTNRNNCINNLKYILKSNYYRGVNIDLEGVYYWDRSYYSTFIREVYTALKPLGYTVTASVPAKTWDDRTEGWSGAFDYAAIAPNVDQLLLMTYDEHYPGGSPGAIASIGWVTDVVKYASTVVPKQKILLGVAAYGYDWSKNGTKARSIQDCMDIATERGATIVWDDASQSPYFLYWDDYGVKHTVWFENSYSLAFKLNLVNAQGLGGIGIWRLGLEDANYWNTINTKFNR